MHLEMISYKVTGKAQGRLGLKITTPSGVRLLDLAHGGELPEVYGWQSKASLFSVELEVFLAGD